VTSFPGMMSIPADEEQSLFLLGPASSPAGSNRNGECLHTDSPVLQTRAKMGTACTHFRGGERSGEESDEEPADDSVTDSSRWKVARVCNTGLSVCRHSPFLLEPAGEEAGPNKNRDCSSSAGMDIIPGNDVTHSPTAYRLLSICNKQIDLRC
jgi:hypothetical protein